MLLSRLFSLNAISRGTSIALVLASMWILPGCWVYSVEPLYEEGLSRPDPDLLFDASLVGSWARLGENCPWTLAVSADPLVKTTIDAEKHARTAEEPRYELTMTPGADCKADEKTTKYQGHLVTLDGHRFLDAFPQDDMICTLCLPLHSFFLVSLQNDRLDLVPIDQDWLSQAMKGKRIGLNKLENKSLDGAVVLTGSSRELKTFVVKYAEDKSAFKADSDLTLKFKRR